MEHIFRIIIDVLMAKKILYILKYKRNNNILRRAVIWIRTFLRLLKDVTTVAIFAITQERKEL
jgi:hypothetical protein